MKIKQTTERRISAALRIGLVALLLCTNVAIVVLLSVFLQTHAVLVYLALQMIGLIVTVGIQGRWGSPSYKTAWTILVLGFPVTGVILYLLWGGSAQRKKQMLQPMAPPPHKDYERTRSQDYIQRLEEGFPTWGREAKLLLKHDFMLYKNTAVTYFPTGEEFFADVLSRLELAEHFIFLEYFIVAEGKLWDRIYAILRDRASRGVEVKLLFDDFGSMTRFSDQMVGALRQCGIDVLVFNPVHQYVNRLYFNYRDHRKILCIDGDFAYTGGINLADEYANIVKRFGHWKDSACLLEGEGAWGLTRQFIHLWQRLGGELQSEYDYYRPHGPVQAEGWCQPFCDGPNNPLDNPAEEVYLQAVSTARNFLYITTPYLALEDSMLSALCTAADSGVEVCLLMPGIPDHKYTYLAAGAYYDRLLSHGVRLFEYTPGFLHSKTLVADGEMAVVGTINMDYRSFQLHYECGVALYGMPAVEHVLRDVRDVMAQSREILLPKWRKRNIFRKLSESVLRIFTIWM